MLAILEAALVVIALLAIGMASLFSIHLRSAARTAAVELNRAKDIVQEITVAFSSRVRNIVGTTELIRTDVLRLQEKLERLDRVTAREDSGYQDFKTLAETTLKSQTVSIQKLNQFGVRVQGLTKDINQLKTQMATFERRDESTPLRSESLTLLPGSSQVVLSRLTETELGILTLLTNEGPKPAPELKALIGKSREHTARLMNTLFKEGYVERDTSTLPYRYKVREELKNALQERRSSSSQFLER